MEQNVYTKQDAKAGGSVMPHILIEPATGGAGVGVLDVVAFTGGVIDLGPLQRRENAVIGALKRRPFAMRRLVISQISMSPETYPCAPASRRSSARISIRGSCSCAFAGELAASLRACEVMGPSSRLSFFR